MKLSVGMYVRTEYGISKIINIFPEKRATFIETDNGLGNCSVSGVSLPGGLHKGIYLLEEEYEMFIENNVKKTIIELIQVGDYVNGYPVYEIIEHEDNTRTIVIGDDNKSIIWEESSQYIKTILTKEQYESMAYKVGE